MRVLLTGASKGLGLVLGEHLLRQGHELFAAGRSRPDLDCTFIPFDFERPQEWNCALESVDAVVHCAGGGLGLRGPLITAESFYRLLMVNLGGQAEINRFVLPEMMYVKKGYIVHVCSIASGEAVGSVGYNTVKAALAAYVRSLGREMAPHNVVVTGIAPGGFIAPQNAMERLADANPHAYAKFIGERLPRGFMGKAEELLPLIDMLISPAASMMAGTVIPVDAGEGRYY